jgi:hypothetical protein
MKESSYTILVILTKELGAEKYAYADVVWMKFKEECLWSMAKFDIQLMMYH